MTVDDNSLIHHEHLHLSKVFKNIKNTLAKMIETFFNIGDAEDVALQKPNLKILPNSCNRVNPQDIFRN